MLWRYIIFPGKKSFSCSSLLYAHAVQIVYTLASVRLRDPWPLAREKGFHRALPHPPRHAYNAPVHVREQYGLRLDLYSGSGAITRSVDFVDVPFTILRRCGRAAPSLRSVSVPLISRRAFARLGPWGLNLGFRSRR